MTHFSHPSEPIEFVHRGGIAVECGTLALFLDLLRYSATVLLMPLSRTIPHVGGTWLSQSAVHLTARKIDPQSPVYYCTFPAAQADGLAHHGRLTYPILEACSDQEVKARCQQLVTDLQTCLTATLEADPRVLSVYAPARYRLPDAWVWSVCTTFDGTSITFQHGRWESTHTTR
jgi:hypothetical protein